MRYYRSKIGKRGDRIQFLTIHILLHTKAVTKSFKTGFYNKKYTIYNLCCACLNSSRTFLMNKYGFNMT